LSSAPISEHSRLHKLSPFERSSHASMQGYGAEGRVILMFTPNRKKTTFWVSENHFIHPVRRRKKCYIQWWIYYLNSTKMAEILPRNSVHGFNFYTASHHTIYCYGNSICICIFTRCHDFKNFFIPLSFKAYKVNCHRISTIIRTILTWNCTSEIRVWYYPREQNFQHYRLLCSMTHKSHPHKICQSSRSKSCCTNSYRG